MEYTQNLYKLNSMSIRPYSIKVNHTESVYELSLQSFQGKAEEVVFTTESEEVFNTYVAGMVMIAYNQPTKRLNLNLPLDIHDQLALKAKESDITLTQLVTAVSLNYLRQ